MVKQINIRLFLTGVLLSFSIITVSANNPKRLKKQGKAAYLLGDYYLAIEKYAEYYEKNKSDEDVALDLANLYRITRDYKLAKKLYEPFLNNNDNKYKDAVFYYAQIQMALGEYGDAKNYFDIVRKNPRGLTDPDASKQIRNYIKACEANIEGRATPDDLVIDINRLGDDINHSHMDYAPFPLNETSFMYSSLRINETDNKKLFNKSNNEVRKLYLAKKMDTVWTFDKPLDKTINLPNVHTGNGVISEDGETFYFTQSRVNWQNKLISEILVSYKKDEGWTVPEKLPYPINDEECTNTHPCIGSDIRSGAEILYFVSDRPKGAGGKDIWFVSKNPRTGEFSKPRNAGRRINTPADEITPFYDGEKNELYFSSNGWLGVAGMDVYKARGSGSSWKKNSLLPVPINTGYDETYFVLEKSDDVKLTKGLFASNRPESMEYENGTCCEDLYEFSINKLTTSAAKGNVYNMTNTEFYSLLKRKFNVDIPVKNQGDPLDDVQVYLYEKENGEDDFLVAKQKTDKHGNFYFDTDPNKEYFVRVENFGYFDKKVNFDTKKNFESDTVEIKPIGLNFIRPDLKFRVEVYFDFNKSNLSQDAKNTIDTTVFEIINLLPNAVFEISSHTDNHGSDTYNIKLSDKRAYSIKEYLVRKGIKGERLVSVGYGETMPIEPNENPDGSDNPEGRALNRRSEIRIIDSMNTQYSADDLSKN